MWENDGCALAAAAAAAVGSGSRLSERKRASSAEGEEEERGERRSPEEIENNRVRCHEQSGEFLLVHPHVQTFFVAL